MTLVGCGWSQADTGSVLMAGCVGAGLGMLALILAGYRPPSE